MSCEETFEYLQDQAGLARLCERLASADWVALDTEFMREKTYYPQLCLLQLATPQWAVCVDPLAELDLAPLFAALMRSDLIKVLHAASQDLEIFHYLHGQVPAPLFDTQLAAPLLGYADQIGYGNLVAEVLGDKLDKAHSRADWAHRPLGADQLRYAADDVIYLARLYPIMLERLQQHGRLQWLEEDFDRLADPQRYASPPQQAWRRIKAADRLHGDSLALLQALAAWRETTAQAEDRPRGWLMRDDALLDIARHRPAGMAQLARIRGVQERSLKRHGETLLTLIKDSKGKQPEPLARSERPDKASPLQEAVVDLLMALVRVRGVEQSLSSSSLASRKDVVRLVLGDASTPLLQGWRRAMIGAELQRMLAGELCLRVRNGALHIDTD